VVVVVIVFLFEVPGVIAGANLGPSKTEAGADVECKLHGLEADPALVCYPAVKPAGGFTIPEPIGAGIRMQKGPAGVTGPGQRSRGCGRSAGFVRPVEVRAVEDGINNRLRPVEVGGQPVGRGRGRNRAGGRGCGRMPFAGLDSERIHKGPFLLEFHKGRKDSASVNRGCGDHEARPVHRAPPSSAGVAVACLAEGSI